MTELFSDTGVQTTFVSLMAIIIISFAIMVLMIMEYRHIHKKRIALLNALDDNNNLHHLRERHIVIILYIIGMTVTTAIGCWYFFSLL